MQDRYLQFLKKRILILFLILLSACKQESSIQNPNGIWTESELTELESIVSRFDQILTTEYKTDRKKKAYLEYSNYVLQNNVTPILNGMEELSSDLKTFVVFDKIWWKYSDSNSERFSLKTHSNYLKYLTEIEGQSDLLNDYVERFNAANDLQPSVVAGFAKNIEDIDLTNKNNRLIFAIHYLTLINR
tara:strand:+ start:2082 stop:2645 length:564 start_codon:yes stop_codon:yes gene_type:complete